MSFKFLNTALTYDDLQIVPLYSEIESRKDIDVHVTLDKKRNYILKIPIISSPMDTVTESAMAIELGNLGGLGIIHRFMSIDDQINHVNSALFDSPLVGAAVGVNDVDKERVTRLMDETILPILNIDIAHGHHKKMKEMIKWVRANWPDVHIMAGAIATGDATKALIDWGADSIRCGIGNGSMCETRIRTKVGIPQVTALDECCRVAELYGIPIIADGGIRMPGDVALAMALGSTSVILGSLLSGTKESPGEISKIGMWPNEVLHKKYQGSASHASKVQRNEEEKNVEGNSTIVPYRGKTKRIVSDIMDGVRSSMSYVGANNMSEFQAKAKFVRVTEAGRIEALPHGLLK